MSVYPYSSMVKNILERIIKNHFFSRDLELTNLLLRSTAGKNFFLYITLYKKNQISESAELVFCPVKGICL